jgi:hypothetical protein
MSDPDFFLPEKKSLVERSSSTEKPTDAAFERSMAYQNHIRSSQWRGTREVMFKLRGKKCEICGSSDRLELHHKTYERFGHELPSDLEILCKRHHEEADRKRKVARQRAFDELCESSRTSNALETYVSKVYGDGYRNESMYREASDWLERKKQNDAWDGGRGDY